jgi:signal transduction histidine kinase/CheY-like chemotaxis protein
MTETDRTDIPEAVRQEIQYYKQRIDELAGENLKQDYAISGLRKDVKQRRLAFTLLSDLQLTIGMHKEISAIFDAAIPKINATIGMDKTVVLLPTLQGGVFRPGHWTGFSSDLSAEEVAKFTEQTVAFPPEFLDNSAPLFVNKKTEPTPLIEQLRTMFGVPYFIAVPVIAEGKPIAVIFSGRNKEAGSLFPPIDQGDVETFKAVAALIAAVAQNLRVAVLQEMDRLKTDFFANISHEFRTPITLTLGPLETMLSGRAGELPEQVRKNLEIMQRNQSRLLGLINQILDLAKLEAGRMGIKAQLMRNMNRFIEERATQFKGALEKRGLDLVLELAPEANDIDVYIDVEKLDKVVFNLLSNAMKFTKQGKIAVSTKVTPAHMSFTVADSGMGIRHDQLAHIFDRFRQADGSASREHAGTGIGLALVKEYANLHGGDVHVQSEYGAGTSFTITLPRGKAHIAATDIIEAQPEEEVAPVVQTRVIEVREGAEDTSSVDDINKEALASKDRYKSTVLYVDDNRDLRTYVRDVLVSDYNVFLAVNGQDGLEKALEIKPDLILSDLMMPIMTGTQLCQRVRDDLTLKETPFVLLTAKSGIDSKIEGLEVGADDYLAKPFSEGELRARLKNLIALRKNQTRLKRELSAAREIQRALLPPTTTDIGKIRIDALYRPCEELSGDFFDVINKDEWVYMYLADVTSHGTAAAQVTYIVRELFREALRTPPSGLPELLANVGDKYATFGLGFDVVLQTARVHVTDRRVEYVRLGAPPAVRVLNGVQELVAPQPGQMLSTEKSKGTLDVASFQLRDGEAAFMVTDGAYEFESNGREFGQRRLMKVLAGAKQTEWQQPILDTLIAAHGQQGFDDDLTILRLASPS